MFCFVFFKSNKVWLNSDNPKQNCQDKNKKCIFQSRNLIHLGLRMRNLLWGKQLHATVPSMISFYSHCGVWEQQVGEKEGWREGVCVWERETKWDSWGIWVVSILKQTFKFKSLSTAGMKQNSFHRMSTVEFTTCQKILECISPWCICFFVFFFNQQTTTAGSAEGCI